MLKLAIAIFFSVYVHQNGLSQSTVIVPSKPFAADGDTRLASVIFNIPVAEVLADTNESKQIFVSLTSSLIIVATLHGPNVHVGFNGTTIGLPRVDLKMSDREPLLIGTYYFKHFELQYYKSDEEVSRTKIFGLVMIKEELDGKTTGYMVFSPVAIAYF